MATYEQVVVAGGGGAAGNVDGRNVYKAKFATNPCSDAPQLQAWDDYAMNSTVIESLVGTVHNGGESLIAAAHTTDVSPGDDWVPAAAGAGGEQVNRLRGSESYVLLGTTPPAAGDERFFQLAFGCHDDSSVGTAGHQPVLAVKTFYAGAEPVVSFWYNRGQDDLAPTQVNADWQQMTSEVKGTSMAIGVKNTILATGPDTTASALDPVTKPGSGAKWAEEQWIQTAL